MSFFDYLRGGQTIRDRLLWVAGGALCSVPATWILVHLQAEDERFAIAVVSAVWIAVLVALFTGVGRMLALGFVAAIITGSLSTHGLILTVWAFPVTTAYANIERAVARNDEIARLAAINHTRKLSRREWINARLAEPPVLAHGQILANTINECAAAYRARDLLHSYPRNATQLESLSCSEIAATRADSSRSYFIENDRGWRWTYRPEVGDSAGRTLGYRVRVFEDPVIGRQSPQYVTNATGEVRQLIAGKPSTLVASPVPVLQQLYRCIQQVPELRTHDTDLDRMYSHFRSPLHEVLSRCNGLRPALTSGDLANSYGLLTLSLRRGNGGADTVGVYRIDMLAVDPRQFMFELRATPIGDHSGTRSYLVGRDGSISGYNLNVQ